MKCRPGDDPSSCQLCQRAGLKCAFLPTRKERSIAKKQELASGNDAQNAHAITGGRRSTNSTSPWMSRRSLSFSKTSEQEDLRRLYSPDLLMKGVDVFFQHFYPDIFFSLHEPSVRSSAQSGTLKPLLATTILALTARFIPELVELHGSGTAAGDYFADPIRPILLMGADKPSLEKIHGFLFLSLHEWGSGRGATAVSRCPCATPPLYNTMFMKISSSISALPSASGFYYGASASRRRSRRRSTSLSRRGRSSWWRRRACARGGR